MLEDPITDITLALEVNWFQLNTAEYFVPVAVKIPGSELTLARRRGAARTELDVIGEVKDDFNITVQNLRDKLDIRLDAETATQLPERPIQYETGFTLLPGRYGLKLLVRDLVTGRIGTYQTAFAIPNLMREQRLPISTVVLSGQRVPATAAIHEVRQRVDGHASSPLVHTGQKLLPSVTRVFSTSRDLHVFLQAYQRPTDPAEPLVAVVSFAQEGETLFAAARAGGDAPGTRERRVAARQPAAGGAAAGAVRLPGDDCRSLVAEDRRLAGAGRAHPLTRCRTAGGSAATGPSAPWTPRPRAADPAYNDLHDENRGRSARGYREASGVGLA